MMNGILKIVKNGVLIGLILVVTVYFGIYFIAGNDAYKQEILNLTDINMFVKQIVVSNIIGILCAGLFEFMNYAMERAKENEKHGDMKKAYKIVSGSSLCMIGIIILIGAVLERTGVICNEIIGMMFTINYVILMCVGLMIVGINQAIEELLINKKIKKINKE